ADGAGGGAAGPPGRVCAGGAQRGRPASPGAGEAGPVRRRGRAGAGDRAPDSRAAGRGAGDMSAGVTLPGTVPGLRSAGAAGSVLELEAVTKVYPGSPPVTALAGVSFTVAAGELV